MEKRAPYRPCCQETNSTLGIPVQFGLPAGSATSGQSFAHCPAAVCKGMPRRLYPTKTLQAPPYLNRKITS